MKRSSQKCGASPSPKCQLVETEPASVQHMFTSSQFSYDEPFDFTGISTPPSSLQLNTTDNSPHNFSGISLPSSPTHLCRSSFDFPKVPPEKPCLDDSSTMLDLGGLDNWSDLSSSPTGNPLPLFLGRNLDEVLHDHTLEEGVESTAKIIYENENLRRELCKMIFKGSHMSFKASLRKSVITSKNNMGWLEILLAGIIV